MEQEFRYGWPRPLSAWISLPVFFALAAASAAVVFIFNPPFAERVAAPDSSGVPPIVGRWFKAFVICNMWAGAAFLSTLWTVATVRLPATIRKGFVRVDEDGLTVRDRLGRDRPVAWSVVEELRATPIASMIPSRPRLCYAEPRRAGTWLVLRAGGQRIRLGWSVVDWERLVEAIRERAGLTRVGWAFSPTGWYTTVYSRESAGSARS